MGISKFIMIINSIFLYNKHIQPIKTRLKKYKKIGISNDNLTNIKNGDKKIKSLSFEAEI